MNVPLCAPDYSCVSKRARTVKVTYRQPAKGRITDLVIDSTGLKVFGEGEWKVRKHGAEKRRVWRKLQVAHDIVAAEVSLENVHDAEVLPTLLNPLRRKLGRVYADGAYDSKASHQLISRKGATVRDVRRGPRRQTNSRLAITLDSGKRGTQEMRPCW